MATIRREYQTGYYYHIFNCGLNRQAIFTTLEDYQRLVDVVRYYKNDQRVSYAQVLNLNRNNSASLPQAALPQRPRVSLLAYCLMPNHFHFILRPLRQDGITKFLSDLTNSYTRYYNIKYQRLGSLFQGTFKAVHVEGDPSLFNLIRYIHLNPARSPQINYQGRVRLPGQYPFSSYNEWLNPAGATVSDGPEVTKLLNLWGGADAYREFTESPPQRNLMDGIEDIALEA